MKTIFLSSFLAMVCLLKLSGCSNTGEHKRKDNLVIKDTEIADPKSSLVGEDSIKLSMFIDSLYNSFNAQNFSLFEKLSLKWVFAQYFYKDSVNSEDNIHRVAKDPSFFYKEELGKIRGRDNWSRTPSINYREYITIEREKSPLELRATFGDSLDIYHFHAPYRDSSDRWLHLYFLKVGDAFKFFGYHAKELI